MNSRTHNTACIQFEQALEQQPDEPLSDSAAAHVQDCADCSLLWTDLETIRAAAQEWGAEEPEPPARVWIALRAQLEAEGLIREPRAAKPNWLAGWLSGGPRLAMAGAYLSLLFVGAMLVRTDLPVPLVSRAGAQVTLLAEATSAEADLGQTLDSDMKRVMASLPEHNASLATSLQQNLGIVDNMIALCEKSVREQPSNPIAREYLYGAYQQKAVLLATAMDRSTLEDK